MEPNQLIDMRRKDRSVDDEAWIEDLLRRVPVGTLSTAQDGQPFLHINLFVYDPSRREIYFHTAAAGRTSRALRPAMPAAEARKLRREARGFKMVASCR